MLRTSIVKVARPALLSRATFSTTVRAMSAGDTGAPPKTGGLGYVFLRFFAAICALCKTTHTWSNLCFLEFAGQH